MPDAFNAPPPVLEYSTLSMEGIPKWHPEAEAMIDLGEPPDALLEFFEKSGDAVRYYAMSMSRRYDVTRLGDQCILCGGCAAERMVRVGWRARLHLPAISRWPRLWKTDTVCGFSTLHAICLPCYRSWRDRYRKLTLWIMGISGIFLFGVCISTIVVGLRGVPIYSAMIGALGVIFIIGVVTAVILETFAWRHPNPLRKLLPRGVVASGDLELLHRPIAVGAGSTLQP